MSYYYQGNERFDNIFKGIDLPTYNLNYIHSVADNTARAMEPMVKTNVKTINPPNDDMSRAYSAVDIQGLNTSTQKIPDNMVLEKKGITWIPQRPFYLQT